MPPCHNAIRLTTMTVNQTLKAPYTLNREKQTNNLVLNSKKKDFDIQISDDLNASIFCSGRFYEAVVMPAVASIGENYTQKVSGVCLTC